MKVYSGQTSGHVYRQQLLDLLGAPVVEVREKRTKELLNVITEITNPRARIQIVPGRKLNPWLALSESLWLLAGRNDIAALEPYNKRIKEFSDDGEILYGAYGYRIFRQIDPLIERLKRDPNDRRAVLSIWESEDLEADTLDPPCNNRIDFKLRNGSLDMTVDCRSNDLHWGLHAVNLIQFSILQEYIATRLGAFVGIQTHISNSLHIYMDGPAEKITYNMLMALDESPTLLEADEKLFPDFISSWSHENIAKQCDRILDMEWVDYGGGWPFLEFSSRFLEFYRDYQNKCFIESFEVQSFLHEIPHMDRFPGWIKAAEEFLGLDKTLG